jgi:hypothetical protein
MNFLEKDLEEIIYTSGRDVLEEKGLPIKGKLRRQVKIGNYGIADLIEYYRPFYYPDEHGVKNDFQKGTIFIYELKKDKISMSSFLQALGYAKGIQSYLRKREKDHLYDICIRVVGRTIDLQSEFIYIPQLLNIGEDGYIEFYTYDYNVNGIKFTNHDHGYQDYKLRKEGF